MEEKTQSINLLKGQQTKVLDKFRTKAEMLHLKQMVRQSIQIRSIPARFFNVYAKNYIAPQMKLHFTGTG